MDDTVRARLAALHLKADLLAAGLDAVYAAMQAQHNASRVAVTDGGEVADPAAVAAIVAEVVKAADPKWKRTQATEFYTELRATLAAKRRRERGEPEPVDDDAPLP